MFIFGSYHMSIEKSLLTQCVSDNELGKIFAVNAALENFGPLGAAQIYATVWSVSVIQNSNQCIIITSIHYRQLMTLFLELFY